MAVSSTATARNIEGLKSARQVPVVYYLSRNGHLDQPHFMEVPLSSPHGLFLSDVIRRFNLLRGTSMASFYSWSSKRSYKSGFVWHDLDDNDFIYPSHGQEYVLKGSELLHSSLNLKPQIPVETPRSGDDSDSPPVSRRRNQSWAAVDLQEYKTESVGESSQTDERRRAVVEEEEEREDISPPPSDSSTETLESLMKVDGRLILSSSSGNEGDLNRTKEKFPSGRMKVSAVVMQLLSCGSMSLREFGAASVKDQRLSLVDTMENSRLKLEEKEYFSGSLIGTNKEHLPTASAHR